MSIIRIREKAFSLLDRERVKQDRSITFLASKAIEEMYTDKPALEPVPEPPKKGNPQLKKKAPHPQFGKMKDLYFQYFKQWNGFEYQGWGLIQVKALNDIIKSLENLLQDSDHDIVSFWDAILQKMPTFFKSKSLHAIKNNINGIIIEIRTGGRSGEPVSSKYDWRS